ncbi:MAG: 4-hydroxy-tetrahydrodipicolinate synthase [Planctomycetota bacterium]
MSESTSHSGAVSGSAMTASDLRGVYTALITPFSDGAFDEAALGRQVERQVAAGVAGVVPVGTTGESPTLTHPEHGRVIQATVRAAAGRVKVLAGTGSNSTAEAIDLTAHAKDVGADGALHVSPYYNKPTAEGLRRHFTAIADAVDLPVVLYDIPGRTAVAIPPEVTLELSGHPGIIGIKAATGSIDLVSELASQTDPASFGIISGDDSLTLPMMSVGGVGVTSVLSNLLPQRVVEMVKSASAGDWAGAKAQHLAMFPLCRGLLSLATNPIPIKAAMRLAGLDTGEVRLPLTELDGEALARLAEILASAGVSAEPAHA